MDDLISRADVMGAVQDHFSDGGFKGYDDGQKMMDRINELASAEAPDVYKAHEEEHLKIVNSIKELQYAIAKTQTIVGKMVASTEAVTIHEDGTLEVKVSNAHKVGRVLVMDADSHIGGGLFYPDEAVEVVRCKDCTQKHIGGSVTRYYWCDFWDRETDCNNGCSWGERKGGEDNG